MIRQSSPASTCRTLPGRGALAQFSPTSAASRSQAHVLDRPIFSQQTLAYLKRSHG